MSTHRHARPAPALAATLLLAAACGGGGGGGGFAVKGAVTGLQGSGLVLHLAAGSQVEDLAVPTAGAFAFAARLGDGAAFEVTVKTDPTGPSQACTVTGGTGAVAGADASVSVACATRSFTVGGTVSGLAAGSSVTLRNNGGDDLAVDADGAFTFATPVQSGAAYAVTVAQHPASPSQTCVVGNGSGTVGGAAVTGVTVSCEPNDKPVAGRVDGLLGDGLVLQVNDAFDTPVSAAGDFQVLTNLRAGVDYAVSVKAQPTSPWQRCEVTSGATGKMVATGVTGVVVTCATETFAVGGTATGVLRPGLSLALTVAGVKGPAMTVDADGTFTFPDAVQSGAAWLVTVESVPASQACAVTGGGGVMAGAAVGDVRVACGCAAGLGNCNGLPGDGCETSTLTDVAHCGGCGNACAFANAGASCASGACQLGACLPGFGDCRDGAADGCETNLQTDPAHCGTCVRACSFAHASAACASGTCALGICSDGWGNCNGDPADGCETDVRTTVAHCGGCNQPCTVANGVPACAAGVCGVQACNPGFGNCNGLAGDGCEVDVNSDPQNCGQCLLACSFPNTAGACVAGACTVGTCDAGFADCNGVVPDGCEVNTQTDPLHCGSCTAQACNLPHAPQFCSGGACAVAACDAGWGNCNGVTADGCELPVLDDPNNCGGCNATCASDRVCSAGSCQIAASCRDLLLQRPGSASGVYTIDPDGAGPVAPLQVYCDMLTDGGGWTFFAHLGGDYQAGALFTEDLPTYLADRSAPKVGPPPPSGEPDNRFTASYGLGATVYQNIGATELMVSVINPEPSATLAKSLVFYRFAAGASAFTRGPIPCTAVDLSFQFRVLLGAYLPGQFAACDDSLWYPYDGVFGAGGQPLVMLANAPVGTIWGTGAGYVPPPGSSGNNLQNQDSWWYAR